MGPVVRPWHQALRVAAQNMVLRRRVGQLERRVVAQAVDLAAKDRTIRRLKQDATIVAAMVRDPRDAADFLEWDREADAG